MNNILFVCSANKDRSKTAEDHFSEQYPNFVFDSAGTNKKSCNQLGTNYLQEDQLEWADVIYVMENKHHRAVKAQYGSGYSNKITVLKIPDTYKYGSGELVELLEEKVSLQS